MSMIDIHRYVNMLQRNHFVIYLFHGVIHQSNYEVRNYTKKHLEVDEFHQLLIELKTKGQALSMDDIVDLINNNHDLPEYAYAVTFDDGFENNVTVAAPVLADLQIPATFYISTYLVDNNAMTWIDRIEFCLENTKEGVLSLEWESKPIRFDDTDSKIQILNNIRSYVKADPEINPDQVVSSIYDQCNMNMITENQDPIDKKMDWKQVRELHAENLFTIGGHSHRHVSLASLNVDELENELSTSISLLKSKAGISLRHYSYPEGQEHDFSDQIIEKLKNRGIICCPTAIDGTNDKNIDLFHLKRVLVV